MYQKVLIPLDGSSDSEKAIELVRPDVAPDGELILLHVVPPGRISDAWQLVLRRSDMTEEGRSRAAAYLLAGQAGQNRGSSALLYLAGAARRLEAQPGRCRCEIAVHGSIARGILDFAEEEGVDLIAMWTHEGKGRLARFIRKSVSRDVRRKAPVKVKMFNSRELLVPSR